MKLTIRKARHVLGGTVLGATALMCAAGVLPAAAHAATAPAPAAAPATTAPAWHIRRCHANQTEVWLGVGLGGGTAGTIFYPLEFTNVGRHACTLRGFPLVKAISKHGHQIGKSSRHLTSRHGTVTLWPGWTAHATLGIIEAGNVCSHPVTATTLKVRAPHQGRSTQLPFAFQACPHKRVLVVGPVKPGVGIP
jgi:hypothetical protein